MSDANKPADVAATEQEKEVSLYADRIKIYPRAVFGYFTKWRWLMVWLTQLVFYGVPWLVWNDRQGILLDLEARRFYIFGLVLYPQDFIYLTGLLVVSALSLFLFTAVAGRLWCGFACPQTVYTKIFLWIEHKVEGDRSARMRLDQADLSARKLGKKWLKHTLWVLFALWTGLTFVGYFTPIRELLHELVTLNLGPWEWFWTLFYSFATYGNAGFLREQVCKYMCPYARFQSAMFDHDTMIVTYDAERGEPRGGRSKKADPKSMGLGACVDCTLCVQVCPTGIDIRNGLQYECIGCGACIDVCDEVMDKMAYPRGLIKYSTQNGMTQGWGRTQMLRRALRPRVLIYTGILLLVCLAMAVSLWLRTPLKVDVIRDRGALARMVGQGRIENVYQLQIMNATESVQTYQIAVEGLPNVLLDTSTTVEVLPTEIRTVAARVQVPPNTAQSGSHTIVFQVQDSDEPDVVVREKSTFLIPR